MIPLGGFRKLGPGGTAGEQGATLKSMRTADLKDYRVEELQRLDDTSQREKSRHEINQYNQVKNIIINFSFIDRNKKVFSTDITYDVIDELRRERKIMMVINDTNVDQYIDFDMTELVPTEAVKDD